MESRKTVGERLLERVNTRDRISPRLTRAGSRFSERFDRYARTSSVSRIGDFFTPRAEVAFADGGHEDPALLSSAPYWARLQRLGNARLRREQRLAALADRTQGRAKLSAISRLPDVRPRSLPFFGLPSLLADQFEVLNPLPDAVDPEMMAAFADFQRQDRVPGQVITPNVSQLSTREFVSAKVIRGSGKRPIQRIQERAPAPKRAVAAARQAISRRFEQLSASGDVPPSRSTATKTTRPVESRSASPEVSAVKATPQVSASRRPSRAVRRSMKGRANPVRAFAVDFEAALPDDFLPPTRHAQGRMNTGRSGAKRGLRTALSRTPLMAALEPQQIPGSSAPESTTLPARHAAQLTQRVGSTTARRMAHRSVSAKTPMLSTSPVRRPALMAPSAVTLGPGSVPSPAPEAVGEGPARSAQPAPMVRALERSTARPVQVSERPLSERAPVASRPVRTRSGQFAPESTVLVPGIDPVSVTEDAQPEQAIRIATRAAASAHAVQRMDRADQVDERSASPAPHRPNRVARTRRGTFAPESTVLSPELNTSAGTGSATPDVTTRSTAPDGVTRSPSTSTPRQRQASESPVEHAAARRGRAASTSPSQTPRLKDVAERIDAAPTTVSAPKVRRARGVPQVEDSAVLAPVSRPEEELSQGQHAADRLQRVPVVGQSTTKVAKRMADRAETQIAMATDSAQRRVAPRLFKSPLSHIRVMRSAKGGRPVPSGGSAREQVVLQATAADAMPAATSERQAQRAGQERVEAAWEQAGRPLDWTDARIEVIQVPLMVGAAAGEREAPRTERTTAGEYIPVRTGRTRTTSARPSTDGITLARPESAGPTESTEGQNMPGSMPFAGTGEASADPQAETSPGPRQRTGAWRSGFDATMGRVQSGAVHKDLPIWAQRSTGRPRITGADDLVQQLATASAPEDVVQVLMDSGDAARRATSSLPQPVIQVIQQIKTEAARTEVEVQNEQRQERAALPNETVRARATRREGARSTTRIARGMTGLNPRGSASAASAPGMSKVTQLAKRLQELIAMAESQNRSGARQQVRMAEDSSAAKAEGQSAPTSAESGRDVSADIDTLTREVIEQVTRELEMRRERRQEDPDGRSIWW